MSNKSKLYKNCTQNMKKSNENSKSLTEKEKLFKYKK